MTNVDLETRMYAALDHIRTNGIEAGGHDKPAITYGLNSGIIGPKDVNSAQQDYIKNQERAPQYSSK